VEKRKLPFGSALGEVFDVVEDALQRGFQACVGEFYLDVDPVAAGGFCDDFFSRAEAFGIQKGQGFLHERLVLVPGGLRVV
jgi:hypothetical protein